jgi:hypothetical protein
MKTNSFGKPTFQDMNSIQEYYLSDGSEILKGEDTGKMERAKNVERLSAL